VRVDVAKPAVERELDPAVCDGEDESAIGAFVIFPAAMGLFEKLVTEMLDGLLKPPSIRACSVSPFQPAAW
jgi:hypothetical protein